MPVVVNLRGTLKLSGLKDTHYPTTVSGAIPFFKVPCSLTMDLGSVTEHWASSASSDNPLFGFFNESAVSGEEKPSRPSLVQRLFRH